jgi:uncharacterized protein (TIGR02118 family)
VIARLGMAARAPHLSYEDFQAHWAGSHGDATLALPGLRGYVQLPAVLSDGAPVLSEWGYDAISTLDFDSVEAMDAAFASEGYRTVVKADEAKFIDKSIFQYGVYSRTVLREGDAPVTLAVGDAGEVVHDGPHVRLDALPERPAPFARVDLLGFAGLAQALAACHEGARHLTRPNRVR